jgi:hypothetical protein
LGDGQNTPEELHLLFPHRHPEMSEARPLNVHSFLFGFDDLGGLSGLRTWLDVIDNHRPTISLLLTAHYSPSLYVENRFLNIVGAAEALHRSTHPNLVLSKSEYRRRKRLAVASIEESVVRTRVNDARRYANEPRLADRLRDLARDVGSELGSLLCDVHRWATLVARTRNRLTHIERGPSPVARVAWAVRDLADCTYYVTSAPLFSPVKRPYAQQ